ncbi:MAG TPA: magnesium transporter [Thermoflexia bacterium]|jgi:magnesium transporter|nr:magnesium transporter [Thermoflexia bacterium]
MAQATPTTRVDIDAILAEVRAALSEGDWERAVALIEALRPPDQADVFEELPPEEQDQLLPRLDLEDSADILEELEEEDAAEVAARLKVADLARILDEMEPDEAADLLGDIPPERAAKALAKMEEAEEVRPLLAHADDTAGGLMTSAEVLLHKDMTAEEAIAYLRSIAPESETVYYLFVVDEDVRLVGVVSLRELVIAPPDTRIEEIMDPDVIHVRADADQEEAARLMSRYDLLALPVVDEDGRLLGLITHDDLVEVLEEEATEDIYRLGGVPEEQPIDVPVPAALRTRLPWLVLNLGTAMASATVLSIFESTIARVAALAAFFPIVAGVSGSAGTQTLTVVVRGLALGELEPRDGLRALAREVLIGLTNGLVLGGLVALIAAIWKGTPMLGFVVGLATLLNMISAGIAGVLVPLGMQMLRIDPALASPILVTTTTDAMGYFMYLGLATLILPRFL